MCAQRSINQCTCIYTCGCFFWEPVCSWHTDDSGIYIWTSHKSQRAWSIQTKKQNTLPKKKNPVYIYNIVMIPWVLHPQTPPPRLTCLKSSGPPRETFGGSLARRLEATVGGFVFVSVARPKSIKKKKNSKMSWWGGSFSGSWVSWVSFSRCEKMILRCFSCGLWRGQWWFVRVVAVVYGGSPVVSGLLGVHGGFAVGLRVVYCSLCSFMVLWRYLLALLQFRKPTPTVSPPFFKENKNVGWPSSPPQKNSS